MAKSALLVPKESTCHDFGWAKRKNLYFFIMVALLGTEPSFIRFLHEEGYLNHPLCFLVYFLEGSSFQIVCLVFIMISSMTLFVEVAYRPSLRTASLSSVRLVLRSTGSAQVKLKGLSICQQKISTPQRREQDHNNENFCSGAQEKSTNELQRTLSEHWQQQKLEGHNPEPNTPTGDNPDTQTLAGACGREELTSLDEMELDHSTENFCSGAQEKSTNELQRTLSEHWQQQKQEGHSPEPNTPTRDNPDTQTLAGACGREELTSLDEMELDHSTENFCSGAQEKSTNELQRTLSEQWQQQKQEGHNPEPNTPTRNNPDTQTTQQDAHKRRTRRRRRNNPDIQTTPQDTHERCKRQRLSNDQCKKHFYMDSAAAYHSTFDPSVIILPYPALLKSPIESITGFGGSTSFVAGNGCINSHGVKLKDVLFIPNSSANLVCVGQLTRDYHVKVVFYEDKFWIEGLHSGVRVGEGHRQDGNHYVVDRLQLDSLIKKRRLSKKKAKQYTR